MKIWLLAVTACMVGDVPGDVIDNEDFQADTQVTGAVTFDDQPLWIDWHNSEGTWRIYKECLGPIPGANYIGHDGSVGPGYIATVWNRNHQIVVDDTAMIGNAGPNGGRTVDGQLQGSTGLGEFGFHLARGYAPFPSRDATTDHTHQISGRWCNANRRSDDYAGYRGWGVRRSSITQPATLVGGEGQLVMEVVLGDAYSDLASVRYTYRVGPNYVKQWVRVTTLCDRGTCDAAAAGGNAFVKEPKLIAGVNPESGITISQMNIFNDTGHTGTTLDRHNRWSNSCGASPSFPGDNFLCLWGGENPVGSTGQCNDPERRRVRFWHPGVACKDDPSCLVVAVRGVDYELGPSYPYQGEHGLDLWAQHNVAENREVANPTDTNADGFLEANNCHQNSAAIANRRWEMIGYGKDPVTCGYAYATAGFHAWEGGSGTYDCEPLYYRFGPAGESYVEALSYGFGHALLP